MTHGDDKSDPGSLGLALNALRIDPYNPDWPVLYEIERKKLSESPGCLCLAHIGSTAVPGLSAKPIVDIAMRIDSTLHRDSIFNFLREAGYIHHGEYGLPGREFFTRGDPPVIHLHVVNEISPHWHAWINFRNYLRQHPDCARQYEIEKKRLIMEAGINRNAYTIAKSVFIQNVLSKATSE
ncbi:MAG TPA: GrpB family protein [Kiritimatiellia bacterium]|nr:GrpB family protein [Kiritimatiellia bacterium]